MSNIHFGRAAARAAVLAETASPDLVNHPSHYTSHPSGVEAITITEHMSFNVGSAMKYLFRQGLKGDAQIQDLEKARWFISRELERLTK